jgi:hypothetical protein
MIEVVWWLVPTLVSVLVLASVLSCRNEAASLAQCPTKVAGHTTKHSLELFFFFGLFFGLLWKLDLLIVFIFATLTSAAPFFVFFVLVPVEKVLLSSKDCQKRDTAAKTCTHVIYIKQFKNVIHLFIYLQVKGVYLKFSTIYHLQRLS